MHGLGSDVAEVLQIDKVTLVLESAQEGDDPAVGRLGNVLTVAEQGFIERYLLNGRKGQPRHVTLRQVQEASRDVYGDAASWIRSEACLRLDFGKGRMPGLLVLGSEDPHHFSPQQGTDLLTFFGGVFERTMRHWLS